jgi:type II secretory pathway component PulF
MLDAGVSITRALQSVSKTGVYGRLFSRIEEDVARGNGLCEAVENHKKRFQKVFIPPAIEPGNSYGDDTPDIDDSCLGIYCSGGSFCLGRF